MTIKERMEVGRTVTKMDLLSIQASIFLPPLLSFLSGLPFSVFISPECFQDAEIQFLAFPSYCLDSESSERLVGREGKDD